MQARAEAARAPPNGVPRVFASRRVAQQTSAQPAAATPAPPRPADGRPRLRRDPVTGDLSRQPVEGATAGAAPDLAHLGLVKQRERSRRMEDGSMFASLRVAPRVWLSREGQQQAAAGGAAPGRRASSAPPPGGPRGQMGSRRSGERGSCRPVIPRPRTAEMIADERALEAAAKLELFSQLALDVELDVSHSASAPEHWHQLPATRVPTTQDAAAMMQANSAVLQALVGASPDEAWDDLARAALRNYDLHLRREAKDRRKRGMSELPHGAAEDAALGLLVQDVTDPEAGAFAHKALLTLQHNPRWSFAAKERALRYMGQQLQ